jgi:hypothetical protein
MPASSNILWTLVMLSIFVVMVALAWDYPPTARFLPFVIGIPGIMLTLFQLTVDIRDARKVAEKGPGDTRSDFEKLQEEVSKRVAGDVDLDIVHETLRVVAADRTDSSTSRIHREMVFFGYFIGLVAGVLLFGFWLTIPVFLVIFLRLHERENWRFVLALTGAAWLIVYAIFDRLLSIILHPGFITEYFVELMFPD